MLDDIVPFRVHFPALEQPELFIADVRAFFRTLRTPAMAEATANEVSASGVG